MPPIIEDFISEQSLIGPNYIHTNNELLSLVLNHLPNPEEWHKDIVRQLLKQEPREDHEDQTVYILDIAKLAKDHIRQVGGPEPEADLNQTFIPPAGIVNYDNQNRSTPVRRFRQTSSSANFRNGSNSRPNLVHQTSYPLERNTTVINGQQYPDPLSTYQSNTFENNPPNYTQYCPNAMTSLQNFNNSQTSINNINLHTSEHSSYFKQYSNSSKGISSNFDVKNFERYHSTSSDYHTPPIIRTGKQITRESAKNSLQASGISLDLNIKPLTIENSILEDQKSVRQYVTRQNAHHQKCKENKLLALEMWEIEELSVYEDKQREIKEILSNYPKYKEYSEKLDILNKYREFELLELCSKVQQTSYICEILQQQSNLPDPAHGHLSKSEIEDLKPTNFNDPYQFSENSTLKDRKSKRNLSKAKVEPRKSIFSTGFSSVLKTMSMLSLTFKNEDQYISSSMKSKNSTNDKDLRNSSKRSNDKNQSEIQPSKSSFENTTFPTQSVDHTIYGSDEEPSDDEFLTIEKEYPDSKTRDRDEKIINQMSSFDDYILENFESEDKLDCCKKCNFLFEKNQTTCVFCC